MADSPQDTPLEERAGDRRGFFRQSLASILGPLADVVERRLSSIRDAMQLDEGDPDGPPRLLRPPGALPEQEFLAACQGNAACVSACPADAIYLLPGPDGGSDAKPVIHAATQPCVLCESLACMAACPSGALVPTPREQVRIGLAAVDDGLCVRGGGQTCTVCVDRCPVGRSAIHLESPADEEGSALARVVVEPDGCVGCGLCEFHCPTTPRAIVVQPIR